MPARLATTVSSVLRTCWLVLAACGPHAVALASENASAVQFGGTLGFGHASVDHPDVDDPARAGAVWALHGGWSPSSHATAGFEFATWGTDLRGVPVHLHTIGPRFELSAREWSGAFAGGTAGLALTEGDLRSRSGVGGSAFAGWRWFTTDSASVALRAGVHAHRYGDGSAFFPMVVLDLQLWGVAGRPQQ